jgi:hypothetical protein
MMSDHRPMSNAERQRRFRDRHPGYRNQYRYTLTAAQLRAIYDKTKADAEALVNGGKAETVLCACDGQFLLFPI